MFLPASVLVVAFFREYSHVVLVVARGGATGCMLGGQKSPRISPCTFVCRKSGGVGVAVVVAVVITGIVCLVRIELR